MEILSVILQIIILATLLGLGIPFYIKFFLTDNSKDEQNLNNKNFQNQSKQIIFEINNIVRQATLEIENKIKESKFIMEELDKKINALKEISNNLEILQKFAGKTILFEKNPQIISADFQEGIKTKNLAKEKIINQKKSTTQNKIEFPKVNPQKLTLEEKREKVFLLADKGWGITEIARESNLSKGEVQLIIDLRKNK